MYPRSSPAWRGAAPRLGRWWHSEPQVLKLLLHVGIQGGEDKVLGGRATDRMLPRVAWDFPVCLTSAEIAFTAMPGASPTTTNGAYCEGCALTTEPLSIGRNFPVIDRVGSSHGRKQYCRERHECDVAHDKYQTCFGKREQHRVEGPPLMSYRLDDGCLTKLGAACRASLVVSMTMRWPLSRCCRWSAENETAISLSPMPR
jgi:hypothetical protein